MAQSVECPLCDFTSSKGEYEILHHMESKHPDSSTRKPREGRPQRESRPSPPTPHIRREATHRSHKSGQSSSKKSTSLRKTQSNSGVAKAWRDIFSSDKRHSSRSPGHVPHKKKKTEAKPDGEDAARSPARDASNSDSTAKDGSSTKLGKDDLGRHVNEKQMPGWLVSLLKKDGAVCSEGIIPVLRQLLEACPSTRQAYLCSPHVVHVSKLRREGSFCGYRNIQMLVSYIINAKSQGCEVFGDKFPTIFQIQDLIENAWDNGFNPQGRVETGGIKGTRKYIGTPEAQAMFSGLQIWCPVQAFRESSSRSTRKVLFKAIEAYFIQGAGGEKSKVHSTTLPPIYFQHRGHSMTIVGFERKKDGQENLLVFDPSYRDTSTIKDFVGQTVRHPSHKIDSLLRAYRRDNKYLHKYNEFEILCLTTMAA